MVEFQLLSGLGAPFHCFPLDRVVVPWQAIMVGSWGTSLKVLFLMAASFGVVSTTLAPVDLRC